MRVVIIGVLSLCFAAVPAWPQEPPAPPTPPSAQQQDQYFSGDVTAIDANSITVKRTVLGKRSDTKTFLITPETRFEGKPKVKTRVTVRWAPGEQGDKAIHILVRTGKK